MLRDHFRPPLDDLRHWEGFHANWPVMMVTRLREILPDGYFAEPRVHSGASAEIDVATFEEESTTPSPREGDNAVATAVWAPPRPTLAVPCDLPAQDVYEVLVYDQRRKTRLVAAIEIVSPANKDRPESRRHFVAKCQALLRERVSVAIVDVVTTRCSNLYLELHQAITTAEPPPLRPDLYAAASRMTRREGDWFIEAWIETLAIGAPLPTLPLWIADDLAIPLALAESYEESCAVLNLP